MARKTSKERIETQRRRVLEGAAELFAKKGFHGTTVEDIAKSLNWTKGSIYYYIPSKDQILFQLHDYAHQLLLDRLTEIMQTDDPPDVKLHRAIADHTCIVCTEMSAVAIGLQMEFALTGRSRAKIVKKRDKYDKMLRQLIQEGIDQGLFLDCDVKMIGFFILGAINYTPHWYKANGRLSKEAIADMLADFMLRALLAKPPKEPAFRSGPILEVAGVTGDGHLPLSRQS